MEHYISDYEIPVLERAASLGDRSAAERLVRFYDSEIASMSARRAHLAAQIERMDEIHDVVDQHF
jgi:hypothetical protein